MPVHCGPQSEQDLLSTQEGDGSPTPSVMGQIKVMHGNMSQLLQKLEAQVNSLQQENCMLAAKVQSIEKTQYDRQQIINNLLQEKDMLQVEIENMDINMQDLEQTLDERQKNINSLQQERDVLDAKLTELEQTLCDRQQSINCLEQEKSTLVDQAEMLSQAWYTGQQNITSLQQEKDMLEDEVQSLDIDMQGLEQTLHERQENITSLQQERDVLDAKVKELEQTLCDRQQSMQQNIASLEQENEMLEDVVQSMDTKVQDLEQTLDERQENINSLQQEKGMLEAEVQSLENTLHVRQQDIKSLMQEWDILDTKVKSLEQTLCNTQQSVNSLQEEKGTLEAKVQELEDMKLMHTQQIIGLSMSKDALYSTLYSSSYPMRCRLRDDKHGCALIINNTQFTTSEMSERTGAEGDTQKLTEAFQSLPVNVDVKTYQNLDLSTMLHVLQDVANRDHTDEDFFACCIMSHGTQGKVFATDGFSAELLEILSLFNAKQCPSLMGKPKLFFIQACQGNKEQTVEIAGAHSDASPSPILAYLSTEADFLLALATVPGYVAYRREDTGADFVNVLTKVLKEDGKYQDLMSMMATVSRELNEKYKYSPFCCTTLRHKLFFPQTSIQPIEESPES